MISIKRVVGDSMMPTLKDGQLVVVSYFTKPRVGHVVVAIMHKREVIKRIACIHHNWQVDLRGDNPSASTDSRTHGTIPLRNIQGVVLWPRLK